MVIRIDGGEWIDVHDCVELLREDQRIEIYPGVICGEIVGVSTTPKVTRFEDLFNEKSLSFAEKAFNIISRVMADGKE